MLKISQSHSGQLVLSIANSSIAKNKRTFLIIQKLLKLKQVNDSTDYILEERDAMSAINNIQRIMKRLSVEESFEVDDNLSKEFAKSQKDIENFNEFSTKAQEIRNNIYNVKDYKSFENSLSDIVRPLKTFQILAAYHLVYSQNANNFSVPGAGKTGTVLAAYNYLRKLPTDNPKHVSKLVVICPLAAFKAWKDEYHEMFGSIPNFIEVYGGPKVRRKMIEHALLESNSTHEMTLISYHSLDSYEKLITHYLKEHKAMVVLDEAHRIKNTNDGLWARIVLRLAPYAKSRITLTGTPAPNSYLDLRNLYKFIWPDKDIIGYSNPQLMELTKNPYDERIEDLTARLSPFFIRITKQNLKLPPAIFNPPIYITMGPIQKRIYDAIDMAFFPRLSFDKESSPGLFKSKLIRLRQAASNPSLLNSSIKDYYDYQDELVPHFDLTDDLGLSPEVLNLVKDYNEIPSKFIAAKNLVQKIISDGGKALIWCEFVGNITGLEKYLASEGIKCKLLYGAVDKDEREKIIDEFHDLNSDFKVIIANPQAVGESISLHKACHDAIYFELSYNAASYMQSKDRIHRVGLAENTITNYYYLLSEGTLDGVIYDRVIQKETNMLGIVESEAIPLITNNADFMDDDGDDLKAMLKDYYKRHGLV